MTKISPVLSTPEASGLPVTAGASDQSLFLSTAPATRALQRLAASAALRAAQGAAGRQRALLHYDEARVVAQTLDLLGL